MLEMNRGKLIKVREFGGGIGRRGRSLSTREETEVKESRGDVIACAALPQYE